MVNSSNQISVIVPVYNVFPYLRRCVDSILVQSYPDFELILVDDGSTDGSGQICEEYAARDSRVRVLHTTNSGVSHARNTGMEHAQGEYLFFVDSDDEIGPDYIRNLLPVGDEDLVYGGCRNILSDGSECLCCHDAENTDVDSIGSSFLEKQIVFVWCACYRRDIVMIHHIRFDKSAYLWEDVCFNLDYLEHCRTVRFSDTADYCYYQRKESAINRYHAGRLEKCRNECINVETFCSPTDMRLRWFYWGAARNHFLKWMRCSDSLTAKDARRNFGRTLKDPYFRESIPYIRKFGSLDEKIETYFLCSAIYCLFKPVYRCVALVSKLRIK